MLEPLIVLTVLNCFFMFSSTATTCALWWQYRNHRCCVKKVPSSRHTCKSYARKTKSCTSCHASKKAVKAKVDSTNKVLGTSKSVTNVDDKYEKDVEQRKSKSNLRYLAEYKKQDGRRTYSFTDPIKLRDHTIRNKISEASQTTNDTKSTVVMEFSTVQKVVQILDNNGELPTAKVTIIPTQDIIDKNKKFNLETRNKFHRDVASAEKISRSSIQSEKTTM